MAIRIGGKFRGTPMSNQRVPVRGYLIRGSDQTIYRELSRKEERRQQSRYGLRARVDFRWKDREKIYRQGEGFTRDISLTGMFVYADSHPPPRADIRVEVFFSPLSEGVSALQMSAKAHVLRVDPPTTGWICGSWRNLCVAQGQDGRKEPRPRGAKLKASAVRTRSNKGSLLIGCCFWSGEGDQVRRWDCWYSKVVAKNLLFGNMIMGCVVASDPAVFAPAAELPPEEVIFGSSPAMGAIRNKVEKAANANIPVLLQGQSGTGKEILARFIHRRSRWGNGPFVKVNCPAIPGTLLESELFGYERGAFTGAYGTKPGRVELAHRGTLFLDEIAELDPGMQAKLLQLLQDGQFCRIGAQADKRVEVRVVCATNRQLQREINSGTFRQDLFYRINVVTIQLPPLRERLTDIPKLAKYFLERFNRQYNLRARPLSSELLSLMQRHHWPGNIRELENVVRSYVIMGSEQTIYSELLSWKEEPYNNDFPENGSVSLKALTRKVVIEFERKIISQALEAHSWNRKQAARVLNISYRSLLYKISQTGIAPKRMPMPQWTGETASND